MWGLLRNYAQIFILPKKCIQILEYCVSYDGGKSKVEIWSW